MVNSTIITKEHILRAIQKTDEDGYNSANESTKFDLLYNNKRYPPKVILRNAYYFAEGRPREVSDFSGGDYTNNLLTNLGFDIVPKRKKQVWIFQANPEDYDILAELKNPNITESTWSVRQFREEISKGDIGLIWKAGEKAGIYAIIDIISDPHPLPNAPGTNQYWKDLTAMRKIELRIQYRYRKKLEKPLLKADIVKIRGLENLSILKQPQSTNFRVDEDQWQILSDLLGEAIVYWWVNQNQTFEEEVTGGYLWSPKTNKDGRKNPFYDFMKDLRPGDVIFSFCDTRIKAIGTCIHPAKESEKPMEFGEKGANWDNIGWMVEVEYRRLTNPVRLKDHIDTLKEYLPEKYAPLTQQGNGVQSIYLTKLPIDFAREMISLIGPEYWNFVTELQLMSKEILEEEQAEEEIENDDSIQKTMKEQLHKARMGQGKFRARLEQIESKCRVTGVTGSQYLSASHIKPWSKSSPQEKLDGNNGLLFSPHIHHLFDKGYIGFSAEGDLLISPKLPKDVVEFWHIPTQANVGKFKPKQREYLQYHLENIFLC